MISLQNGSTLAAIHSADKYTAIFSEHENQKGKAQVNQTDRRISSFNIKV